MDIVQIISLGCAIITAASAFCAATPTPKADSKLAKVYRIIEIMGLLVGYAKQQNFIPPPDPPKA